MGIAWCRERLEQAQNSKNPIDRILIRCSNVLKPKTYSCSQDRLAEDILYRGERVKDVCGSPLGIARQPPPRSRGRLRPTIDWQSCTLLVPDSDQSCAPIPPPRKKRKRKLDGGDVSLIVNGPQEQLSRGSFGEKREGPDSAREGPERKHNRFVKLSERTKADAHGSKDEKPRNDHRKWEHKIKVPKNISTLSLPNYNDLVKPTGKGSSGAANADDKIENPSGDSKPPRRNQSTVSLPGEGSNSIISSLSEATIQRLEMYMRKCRSFGSLKPQQLLEKLEEFNKAPRSESESSDSWSGLGDWDLGVIEYCDPETADEPVTPKSRLPPKQRTGPMFSVGTPPRSLSPQAEPVETPERHEVHARVMEHVPSDWFSEAGKSREEPICESEKSTKTPPPSPENGPTEKNESSLSDILAKYEADTNSVESAEDSQEPKTLRIRSNSLMEMSESLLHEERFSKRSPTIADEGSIDLKEFLSDPERVLNGLRRASMYENLPGDPAELHERRKNSSLRESLSLFMGFDRGPFDEPQDGTEAKTEKESSPPPLPRSPPPTVPANSSEVEDANPRPLVTFTPAAAEGGPSRESSEVPMGIPDSASNSVC